MADEIQDELNIDLDPPITFNGGSFDRLTLTEPVGKDVQKAESTLKSGVNVESLRAYQIMLITLVSKLPRGVIEQLPIRKLNEASRYLQSFIEAGSL